MKRREFGQLALILPIGMLLPVLGRENSSGRKPYSDFARDNDSQEEIFNRIIKKALGESWDQLPIGELTAAIAMEFIGVPYVAGTLEGEGPEVCRVRLDGLDCVTFFENSLDMARMLKKGNTKFDDLIAEVTYTRYRGGKLTDYTSRLHYTADWITDNRDKHVIQDVTQQIGGVPVKFTDNFMSSNPSFYPPLADKMLLDKIKIIEASINKREYYYIPVSAVQKAEPSIETGDIIAIVTDKKGLDYSHTGLAWRDKNGNIRFLHASSKQKKVVLGEKIHDYLVRNKSARGITVLRPLEIRE